MAEHLYWHATTRNRWRLHDERTHEPTEDWVDLPEGLYPVCERATPERLLHEELRELRREVRSLTSLVAASLRPKP